MSHPDSRSVGPASGRIAERAWMIPLLDVLFEDYTQTAAIRLLRDELAREAIIPLLVNDLADRGITGVDLSSAAGDNLLQGLLALRVKFSWAVAREKAARNIAMTGGER